MNLVRQRLRGRRTNGMRLGRPVSSQFLDRRRTTSMDEWRIGDIRVTRILEMCDPLRTPSEWFPDCTDEAIKPHLHWLTPRSISPATGRLILPIQSYLVRTRHHVILVDSCVGNNKTFKY